MYKQPCEIMYHIFTNGYDEWEEDLSVAVQAARRMCRQYGCVRIYKQTEWDPVDGVFEDGDCILSYGGYPE